MNEIAKKRILETWQNGGVTMAVVYAFLGHDYSGQEVVKLLKAAGLEVVPEGHASALSAGVCEYRAGNEHGNPMCLATGDLIETMKPIEVRYCTARRLADGEFSGGRQVRCTATFQKGQFFDTCGEPCRWTMKKGGEGQPPW